MVEAFDQAGISYWYDEAEIKWGDSITQKVNEGLGVSKYVIVVFSTAFAGKNWPERELNSVLNKEASTGEVKVLPLLVGSRHEVSAILDQYPLLNDKRYLPWDGDLRKIVEEVLVRLGRRGEFHKTDSVESPVRSVGLRIPLPEIRKQFTQLEKDRFLRKSFGVVREYFRKGLMELERHYQEVQTDFLRAHEFKFLCTLYVRGEVGSRCKIWIDGFTSSDAIAYQSGKFGIDSDNSYNDMLNVSDDEHSLGFRMSNMWVGSQEYSENDLLTADQVSEYLWRKFTNTLG